MMIRKLAPGALGLFLCAVTPLLFAGNEEELIELDKAWGNAGVAGDNEAVARLLSDDLVSVDGMGVSGKPEQLSNNEPAPEGASYQPTDFKVMFIDQHTAIMTHGVPGADDEPGHTSLHVWSDKSGSWQVVATSSTPLEYDD